MDTRGGQAERQTGGGGNPCGNAAKRKKGEMMLTGSAFAFFLLITCYKLTHASLWFDETIEYWYSKVMFGALPFSATTNMYQRIVSTLQPPLYNFLLYFWLKISDTEWWFRFFGVVMGFGGMIALYQTVKRFSKSAVLAAGAVFFSSCAFRLTYYWQEAAEYGLMLGSLFWTVWFWFRVLEKPDGKTIVLFVLSAVVPVYSQYGAAFPVAAMLLTAFLSVLLRGDRKALMRLSAAYLCALALAAVPLYVFFLRKQISLQHGGGGAESITFTNGFLRDCLNSLHTVFRWNLAAYYSGAASRIALALLLLGTLTVLLWGRNAARAFVGVNALAWFFYYFAVKLGVYADMSYGGFGNRYNLFFLPLWIVWIFLTAFECWRIVSEESVLVESGLRWLLPGIGAACLICFCLLGWHERIEANWEKEDIRGAVYHWYEDGGAGKDTIVYYAADAGFAYYLRMNPRYSAAIEENVVYMPWHANQSEAAYRDYISGLYGENWPDEIYLAASHIDADLGTIVAAFVSEGYTRDFLFNGNDGYLARLRK